MIDLIVFSVDKNKYAINIENVQRIIQAVELSSIPNAHPYIDGMMSYEDSVVKVLNFRKVVGLEDNKNENLAESSQKFLFYENGENKFAVNIDSIDDIAHIQESDIMSADDDSVNNEFLDFEGILDISGVLINIIKTIKLPN